MFVRVCMSVYAGVSFCACVCLYVHVCLRVRLPADEIYILSEKCTFAQVCCHPIMLKIMLA